MDVKILDVDAAYVKEVDRKAAAIAKRTGRKYSRSDYLKMLIEQDFNLQIERQREDRFDRAIENLATTLNRQERALRDLLNFFLEEFLGER